MAVFHHIFSRIIRGGHTCAVATAAYRSGSSLKLKTKFTDSGLAEEFVFDFSSKYGIGFSAIMTPDHAPEWLKDRQKLWQYIEDIESDKNATLAFESIFAIPEELNLELNVVCIKEFIADYYLVKNLIVDVNLHNDHANNPHVHIICPFRPVALEDSDPIVFGDQLSERAIQEHVKDIESGFEKVVNKHLQMQGIETRISKIPTGIPRYDQLRPWL